MQVGEGKCEERQRGFWQICERKWKKVKENNTWWVKGSTSHGDWLSWHTCACRDSGAEACENQRGESFAFLRILIFFSLFSFFFPIQNKSSKKDRDIDPKERWGAYLYLVALSLSRRFIFIFFVWCLRKRVKRFLRGREMALLFLVFADLSHNSIIRVSY